MRVLMLGWEYPPHISGGLGTACRGLAQGIARSGVDVLFVVPRARGDEEAGAARVLGCNQVALPSQAEEVEVDSALAPYLGRSGYGERLRRLEHSTGASSAFSGRYGPDLFAEVGRYAAAVAAIARREGFDLVHAHDWMTFPAGRAAARERQKPLVVHVHACEHDRSGEHPDPRIREVEQEGLDAADSVVCVSAYTAETLRRHYRVDERKLCVVHNALAARGGEVLPRAERGVREPVVLFLGRVTSQKGPDYFLEAAARVVEVEPRVKFVISGAGDMLPAIVERAARMGLARAVHFTGFLSAADVERMYALADLYVMPSVSEPFGIAPLEALAHDVPVIVSRQSGVSEVLRSALKVDFWNVEELADRILAVLRRPALRRQLAEEGRAEALSMSWEARGARVRALYEEVAR